MTETTDVAARALPERLLTVEDLEHMLQVDRRTIARLCKRGQLPDPLKLGGGHRWRAEEVAEALDHLACDRRGQRKGCEKLLAAV
jgi:predicted DNA-binding transcriptional regulator AlpA